MGHLTVRNRLWILKRGRPFLGEGRVSLLRAIHAEGSITAAARSMGMSYKKAWEQVERMNSLSEIPLVVTRTGGSGGGGTEVTEEAVRLMGLFERMQQNCRVFLDHELQQLQP